MIIALDGPAAAGKGTLAKRLAEVLDFAYLDSGLLYRATAAAALAAKPEPAAADYIAAARALAPSDSARKGLRSNAVSTGASKAAALPEVRAALLSYQQDFAANPPDGKAGAVLDGRDIGTVVCPEAEVKIFVTASAEVRARRRCLELQERGEDAIYSRVLQDVQERDRRDQERAVAPLKPAADAVELDTSDLNREEAFERAMAIVRAKTRRG